ncbi:ANK_REP_REGION domain-containing protein [Chloropicon roscoffensis]|uniref:ANK_REP_REGION domain-containing protein n=1 Tax=Chloropicon roscoffensis TaxID=1461544 RepID=A0AAX4P7F1_9CHLO
MKKRGAKSANKNTKRSRRSANRTALDRLRAELKEVEDEQREARKALEEAQKALEEAQKSIKELDKRKADLRAREKKAAAAVQIEEVDHSREANATRECFLTRLPRDLWDVVADKVDENDRAAFSMTCVLFREIQREKVKGERWGPLRTNLDTSCTFTCSWFEFAAQLPCYRPYYLKRLVRMAAKQNDPITLDLLKDTLAPSRLSVADFQSEIAKGAAWGGHLNLLKKMDSAKELNINNYELCRSAAGGGDLATIKWLRSKGSQFDQGCVADAAGRGHLEAIKEMRRSKARGTGESSRARWSEHAVEEAAKGGHLGVVQWLRQNGCPWSSMTSLRAAQGGHFDVLKWVRSQDPPCPWNWLTCSEAAKGGHLEVLKFARGQDPPCPWDGWTCFEAAKKGHLEVLKFARGQDPPCPWTRDVCRRRASAYGHEHVVNWIDQQEDTSDVE